MIKVGSKAPDFTLLNQDNEEVTLSSFLGKKVVLYFYPKDNTPGCTKQACAFRDEHQSFKDMDIVVIGISKDGVNSHQKFIAKHNLPFMLLADPDLIAIKKYGVWQEKNMFGKKYMGIVRSTFVIDKEGNVIKVYEKANPNTNASDILDFLNK